MVPVPRGDGRVRPTLHACFKHAGTTVGRAHVGEGARHLGHRHKGPGPATYTDASQVPEAGRPRPTGQATGSSLLGL